MTATIASLTARILAARARYTAEAIEIAQQALRKARDD